MTMFLKIYQSTEVIVIFPIRRCILEKCPEILLKAMTGLKGVHHVSRNGCLKHIWYEVGRCEQWLPATCCRKYQNIQASNH